MSQMSIESDKLRALSTFKNVVYVCTVPGGMRFHDSNGVVCTEAPFCQAAADILACKSKYSPCTAFTPTVAAITPVAYTIPDSSELKIGAFRKEIYGGDFTPENTLVRVVVSVLTVQALRELANCRTDEFVPNVFVSELLLGVHHVDVVNANLDPTRPGLVKFDADGCPVSSGEACWCTEPRPLE